METRRVRLDGWKEISAGLGVSERTARRYESWECLPVHRHLHEKRGSVYAWSDELESWKQSRSTSVAPSLPGNNGGPHAGESQERTGSDAAATSNAGSRQGHATRWLPLLGRDHERDAILQAVHAARCGRGSLVAIGGEPGVGKTHLIRWILAEAARLSCLGLPGQCRDMEGAPPYAPVIDMLDHCVRFAPREALRKWLGDSASEIARLMPALRQMFADIPSRGAIPSEQQRRALLDACRGFFGRSAQSQPVVAVFENLQWADEATLLLFGHLAQSVSTIPLLLVGTYRNAECDMSGPLARLLEGCYRDRSANCFVLPPLSLPAVSAMLDHLSAQKVPERLVSFVFEHTEGNPFFVEELFLTLRAHGRLF